MTGALRSPAFATAAPGMEDHYQRAGRPLNVNEMTRGLLAILAIVLTACGTVGPKPTAESSPTRSASNASASPGVSASPSALPNESVATPGVGAAPPAGRWQMLPSMSTPRLDFTATRLLDGRVLMVGGRTNSFAYAPGGAPTASVELFDPTTNKFSRAATFGVARSGHSATLLKSGKVLVAGGDGGGFGTAEVYDPSTDSWASTGPMNTRRTDHVAVPLADGRVLVSGGAPMTYIGFGPQGSSASKLPAEIYDPATDSWRLAATPMFDRPVRPTATLMKDGLVLVVGGQYMDNSSDEAFERSEIYDPRSNTWSEATPEVRAGARQFQAAVALPNGRVLIAGGARDFQATSYASLYDPASNSWTQLPNMHENRCAPGAAPLSTGRVLVVGGGCATPEQSASAEEFDPGASRWFPVASLPTTRGSLQLVVLANGDVLGVGGMEQAGLPTALAELFIPS